MGHEQSTDNHLADRNTLTLIKCMSNDTKMINDTLIV